MRYPRLLALLLILGSSVHAATFTWNGGGANRQFNNPANWAGGSVPPSDGTATLIFSDTGAGSVVLPASFNAAQIQFVNTPATSYSFSGSGNTIITVHNGLSTSPAGGNDRIASNVLLNFSGDETVTVNTGSLEIAGTITGGGSLTKTGAGNLRLTGVNLFSGGIRHMAGTLTLTSSASLGLGPVHFAGGDIAVSTLTDLVILNPVVIEANTKLSGYDGKYITFAGTTTLSDSVSLQSSGTSIYFFSGALGESGGSRQLNVSGATPIVLAGTSSYTGGTRVSNGAVVFGTAAAVPTSGKIESNQQGYVGVAFAHDVQDTVLNRLSTSQFLGTIGFDSAPWQKDPTVFSEKIDLTKLPSIGGLGSYTSAEVSGDIKVAAGQDYRFGGGGGTLYLTSNLSATGQNLQVTSPSGQPLTLVLQGANSFSGTLNVAASVVVLDNAKAVAPTHVLNLLGPGYVGYTERFSTSPNGFLGRFGTIASSDGIVGIDSADRNSPRTVNDAIDLSVGGTRTTPYYLGTSTQVTITGNITPTTGDGLYVTAVKGGDLTIASTLGGSIPSVTVGQANSFDSQGGTVRLTGNNSFSGGTKVLGGTLVAASNTALGTGSVTVNDRATLSVASDVLVSNPLSLTSGARLSGSGSVASPAGVNAAAGAILSPGGQNITGTLTFNSGLTLGSSGVLEFDLKNLNASPGNGWDLLNIAGGALDVSATSDSPFTIDLRTLTITGAPGLLAAFDPTQNYSWEFAVAPVITGFASNEFVFNTSGFVNGLGTGSFFVSQNGNSLAINFTPVPEPSTYVLLALGLGFVMAARLRRRRK